MPLALPSMLKATAAGGGISQKRQESILCEFLKGSNIALYNRIYYN